MEEDTASVYIAVYRRDGDWHEDDVEVEVPLGLEGFALQACIQQWVNKVYGPGFYFEYMEDVNAFPE